jgi:hypothetical protein
MLTHGRHPAITPKKAFHTPTLIVQRPQPTINPNQTQTPKNNVLCNPQVVVVRGERVYSTTAKEKTNKPFNKKAS